MFVGAHLMLAARTNMPELALTMEEGDQFMKAAQNVLRHYDVQAQQKTLDWIAFAGTVGGIYGTRFAAAMFRRKAEAQGARPGAIGGPQGSRRDPQADAFAHELAAGLGGGANAH